MKSAMYGRPFTRLAELDQLDAVGAPGEQLVVLVQLVPVGKLAIGAHLEAEEFFRVWKRGRRLCVNGTGADGHEQRKENRKNTNEASAGFHGQHS